MHRLHCKVQQWKHDGLGLDGSFWGWEFVSGKNLMAAQFLACSAKKIRLIIRRMESCFTSA